MKMTDSDGSFPTDIKEIDVKDLYNFSKKKTKHIMKYLIVKVGVKRRFRIGKRMTSVTFI